MCISITHNLRLLAHVSYNNFATVYVCGECQRAKLYINNYFNFVCVCYAYVYGVVQ